MAEKWIKSGSVEKWRVERYPSVFFVQKTGQPVPDVNFHVQDNVMMGRLLYRRVSNEYLYQHFFFNSFKESVALGNWPVHEQVIMGRLLYRRIDKEHLYEHFFFNSFKSIKTLAWLCGRPEFVRRRHNGYYADPHTFYHVHSNISIGGLLWTRSRPDKYAISSSEKYRRSMYPSVFMLPKQVPDSGFGTPSIYEWTTGSKPSNQWTTTEQ